MRIARHPFLAILALAMTAAAGAAAALVKSPARPVAPTVDLETAPPTEPDEAIASGAFPMPPAVVAVMPITDDEDPVVPATLDVANDVMADGDAASFDTTAPPPPNPAARPAGPDATTPPSKTRTAPDPAAVAARTRAAILRSIRDQVLRNLMLCAGGNDNYCLMGNESAFWVAENGLTRMTEPQIANVVRHQGGYVALCVRGTLMSFEATERDPATGLWFVNIRHIDTSHSVPSTRMAGYNGGLQFWLGADRDLPEVQRAPPRRVVDHRNTEQGDDRYNEGKKICARRADAGGVTVSRRWTPA